MGRTVIEAVQALIDSGAHERAVGVAIVPPIGDTVYIATIEKLVDGIQYLGKLENLGSLEMSLTTIANGFEFDVANRDRTLGQQLTGEDEWSGVRALRGTIFIDISTQIGYFVPEIQGEITNSDVDGKDVSFKFVSDIEVAVVSGRYVSEVFPFKENITPNSPANPIVVGGPGSSIPPGGGGGVVGDDGYDPGSGRYPADMPLQWGGGNV